MTTHNAEHDRQRYGDFAKSLALRYLSAQVAVFLLFGPYIAQLTVGRARLTYMWQNEDAVLLLAVLVLLAVGCVLVDLLIRQLRRPFLTRVYGHLFVIVLGAGAMANICHYSFREDGYHVGRFGVETGTAWFLLFTLVGYSLARPELKLVLRCRQLCQIVSPALLIVAVQLVRQNDFRSTVEPFPATAANAAGDDGDQPTPTRPAYFFVFDGWSYERTFRDGVPKPEFTHLAALSSQSTVFHDAHSPAGSTDFSLPGMMYQRERPMLRPDGRWGFEQDGVFVPGSEFETMFTAVSRLNYQTCVIGSNFPWRAAVGEQVDVCRSYRFIPARYVSACGPGTFAMAGRHVLNATRSWTDPWSAFFNERRTRWVPRFVTPHRDSVRTLIKEDILNVLAHQPKNTFGFFHYIMPHPPFLEPDGTDPLDSALTLEFSSCDAEGYERNLAYVDTHLIGEFVDTMKRAGTFDDALIIMTSDHSWRSDPLRTAGKYDCPVTHVPLIVKLPGQKHAVSVDHPVGNCDLLPMILAALGGAAEKNSVEMLVGLIPHNEQERPPILTMRSVDEN